MQLFLPGDLTVVLCIYLSEWLGDLIKYSTNFLCKQSYVYKIIIMYVIPRNTTVWDRLKCNILISLI